MRVALMCDYSLEYLGGAQTAFIQQARVLAEAGHRVTVIAPKPSIPIPEFSGVGGIDVASIDFPFTVPAVGLPLIRNTAPLADAVERLLLEAGAEVLHTHSEFGLTRAGFTAARRLGLPVVQTVHTFFWQALMPLQPVGAALVRCFYRWLTGAGMTCEPLGSRPVDTALRNMTLTTARLADAIVSPSGHQAVRLRDAGLSDVVVVPNTFRIGTAPEPVPHRTPAEPLRLAWIGRCVEEKRILPFIEALAIVERRLGPDRIAATIIGDGLQLAQARSAAAGIAGVRFLGRVDNETVRTHIVGSHLTCLTSHGFDNQPMTVVESILLGRGVFYVDPELREGLTASGVLAAGPDPESMADKLAELVERPDLAEQVARAAAEAAREFQPSAFEERSAALYVRLVARRADRR
jgi:glycosyltransferase involved in cell wall biosynthesis